MVVGSCRAAFPKYYYDVTNQTCKLFIYGGCNGNGNNFYSQEECEGACSGVTGKILFYLGDFPFWGDFKFLGEILVDLWLLLAQPWRHCRGVVSGMRLCP